MEITITTGHQGPDDEPGEFVWSGPFDLWGSDGLSDDDKELREEVRETLKRAPVARIGGGAAQAFTVWRGKPYTIALGYNQAYAQKVVSIGECISEAIMRAANIADETSCWDNCDDGQSSTYVEGIGEGAGVDVWDCRYNSRVPIPQQMLSDEANLEDARKIIADLLEWESQQGGYEADCWRHARRFLYGGEPSTWTLRQLFDALGNDDDADRAYTAKRKEKVAEIAEWIRDDLRDGDNAGWIADRIMSHAEEQGLIDDNTIRGEVPAFKTKTGNPIVLSI